MLSKKVYELKPIEKLSIYEGMNIIDRIPEGKGPNGQVLSNSTKIITMRIK